MKTLCYNVNDSMEVSYVLYNLSEIIPCFINFNYKTLEVTVNCREEDAPTVERMLAAYV
jgi:hypothetical protein